MKKMNLLIALNILGLENQNISEDHLTDAYNLKRAEIMSKKASGDVTINELELLEQAKAAISSEIKEKKSISPLVTVQTKSWSNRNPFSVYEDSQAAEDTICPECGFENEPGEVICANCNLQMYRPCPNCGRQVKLNQKRCSKCNTFIQAYDIKRTAYANEVGLKTAAEREIIEEKKDRTDETNRRFMQFGMVQWLIILIFIVSICFLVYQIISKNQYIEPQINNNLV